MSGATIEARKLAPTYVRDDERGLFMEITNRGSWATVITGSMREGAELGHHYHRQTELYFFLVSGAARVEQVDVATRESQRETLGRHEGLRLPPGKAHVIHFLQPSDFILLKSRAYREEDPDTFPFHVG